MKRIYRFVAVFLSLFLALSVNVFAYDPVNSGINYTQTANGMVYTNTPNVNLDAINNALNTLPSGVKSILEKEGVKIYYTDGVAWNDRGGVGITVTPIVSYYDGSNKVVKINQRARIYIYSDADISLTLPHECGHAIDSIYGYKSGVYKGEYGISSSPEWIDIFNRNSNSLSAIDARMRNFVSQGAMEAFAEAFRIYCVNPNALNNNCPEVYSFISSKVGSSSPAPKALTKNNFDYKAYADTYPDLKAAFGYDKDALWNHYNNFGKNEGRTAKAVQ